MIDALFRFLFLFMFCDVVNASVSPPVRCDSRLLVESSASFGQVISAPFRLDQMVATVATLTAPR